MTSAPSRHRLPSPLVATPLPLVRRPRACSRVAVLVVVLLGAGSGIVRAQGQPPVLPPQATGAVSAAPASGAGAPVPSSSAPFRSGTSGIDTTTLRPGASPADSALPLPGHRSGRAAVIAQGYGTTATLTAYSHEVFAYQRQGRPDPMAPPPEVFRKDRLAEIEVGGILYDAAAPANSAAIILIGGKAGAKSQRRMMHVGDRVDAYVITRIEPARVLADKAILGTLEHVVLKKRRANRVETSEPVMASADGSVSLQAVKPRTPSRHGTPGVAPAGGAMPGSQMPGSAAPAGPPPPATNPSPPTTTRPRTLPGG